MDVLVSVSVDNATQNAMFTLIMGMGMAEIEPTEIEHTVKSGGTGKGTKEIYRDCCWHQGLKITG